MMRFEATPLGRALMDIQRDEKRAEIQDYLDSLEDDPPTECANCGQVIDDHDSFCGEECQEEFTEGEKNDALQRRIE
jgi:hypothetical protein